MKLDNPPFEVMPDKIVIGGWRIQETTEARQKLGLEGFPDIMQARVLGLDFPTYIKFCANYNGIAKTTKHGAQSPVIRFPDKVLADSLCLLLNKRWSELEARMEDVND